MRARSTFSFYIINNGTAGKNENLLILLIFILRNLDRLRGPAQGAVAAVFIMVFFFFFNSAGPWLSLRNGACLEMKNKMQNRKKKLFLSVTGHYRVKR